MGPKENRKEQAYLSRLILDICDDCNEDGSLSPRQLEDIAESAERLADLVLSLQEWESKQHKKGDTTP